MESRQQVAVNEIMNAVKRLMERKFNMEQVASIVELFVCTAYAQGYGDGIENKPANFNDETL
jgi:hypothetical protein